MKKKRKNPKKSSQKHRSILRWVFGVFIVYVFVMLLVVPPIAKSIAQKRLGEELSREVSIGRISINPLTFSVTVRKLVIKNPDGTPFISWEALYANPRISSVIRGDLHLDSLRVLSLQARVVRRADGSLNFTDLIEKYTEDKSKPAPDVRVGKVQLDDSTVEFEDESLARPIRITLDQISVALREVSTAQGALIPLEFAMRWNGRGSVRGDGTFSVSPLMADLSLALINVELKPIDPFLDQFASLLINKGALSMNGHMEASIPKEAPMRVSFEGDAQFDQLATTDALVGDDFLKCDSARLSRMKLQLAPMSVEVGEISLEDLYCRFVIGEEMDTNVGNILRVDLLGAVKTATDKSPVKKEQPVKPPDDESVKKSFEMPRVNIGAIHLVNGTMSFVDRSVQPNVFLTLDQINGGISNLTSEELQRADVDISAKANNTSRVEVKGSVNPLSKQKPTDLVITCRDVDLIPTSPYSGKFLGYTLAKGKVTVDLKYEIAERKLKAHNLITIDQLTLGERTNSPDATKLPVKLGIAVLKDRDGRMELDVPVQGSLDDPEFGYTRVVWRAINIVFTKILTSPFSILGAMFGGGDEELSFQDFEAGSARLPQDTKKLDVLVKALSERPELQLEIEAATDEKRDTEALRRQKLELTLQTLKFKSQREHGPADTPENLTLTPEERQIFLRAAYVEALPRILELQEAGKIERPAPAAPKPAPPPAEPFSNIQNVGPRGSKRDTKRNAVGQNKQPDTPEAKALKAAATLTPEEIERQLLTATEITPNDLRELAANRAKVIQQYILQGGSVEVTHVFLIEVQFDTTPRVGSRVYFNLK